MGGSGDQIPPARPASWGPPRCADVLLLRLLRGRLRPYRPQLALVVLLQFIGTMAALYLPSLNADIIDNGVARGNTGYITRTGAVMLVVSLVQILCSSGAQTSSPYGPGGAVHTVTIGALPMSCNRRAFAMPIARPSRLRQ